MDVLILARVQYALTIAFHYLFVPLSMGLSLLMVILEGLYLKTEDERYYILTKFWLRIFTLTFAVGVATGMIMKSQFGTNWAGFSRYVGEIFGSALVVEGFFAFILESAFLGILLFGWDRVSPRLHYFSTCMVCLGSHLSAFWIVIANSWMHTPAGFRIVGEGAHARAEITDFWQMCFNPSMLERVTHTTFGAWLYADFLVIAVCAWYMRKGRNLPTSTCCMTVALNFASICLLLQLITGHASAIKAAEYQPQKMAAFEGLYTTQGYAPMYGGGYVDVKAKRVIGFKLPAMLSLLLHGRPSAKVAGLDSVSQDEWPPVQIVFQTYHFMVACWGVMALLVVWAYWKERTHQMLQSRYLLALLTWSFAVPGLANLSGWFSAEVGRQPWVVWNQLRTSKALSESVAADAVLSSIIVYGVIYIAILALFLELMRQRIAEGPGQSLESLEYSRPLVQLSKQKE